MKGLIKKVALIFFYFYLVMISPFLLVQYLYGKVRKIKCIEYTVPKMSLKYIPAHLIKRIILKTMGESSFGAVIELKDGDTKHGAMNKEQYEHMKQYEIDVVYE